MSIGISVSSMLPESTPVTFTTVASNDRSNSPQSRSSTLSISIVISNLLPDSYSGASTLTVTAVALVANTINKTRIAIIFSFRFLFCAYMVSSLEYS